MYIYIFMCRHSLVTIELHADHKYTVLYIDIYIHVYVCILLRMYIFKYAY
jgi:hypothetical protein